MFSVAIELGGARGLRYYRPLAVSPALRGHTEDGSQLQRPGTGELVSITGLAARFCPTGRDLFIEKRIRRDTPSWERSVLGHVVDNVLVELHRTGLEMMEDRFEAATSDSSKVDIAALAAQIAEAGRTIAGKVLTEWKYPGKERTYKDMDLDSFASALKRPELVDRTQTALVELVELEARVLAKYLRNLRRISYFLKWRDWMAEARATIARLQTGINLAPKQEDAKRFGVSPNVRPDFLYAVTLVGDLKTGRYHEFYDTVATGYAIFAEYIYKRRINTAAILAVDIDLDTGTLRSHEVRLVRPDTGKRQLWVTQRDTALDVIRATSIPLHPVEHAPCVTCPYRQHCWQDGSPGGTRTDPQFPSAPGSQA